jgi:peptide deformylase
MLKRIGLALFLLVATAGVATAQDMALSQILIEGEGWKEVTKSPDRVKFLLANDKGDVSVFDVKGFTKIRANGKVEERSLFGPNGGSVDTNIAEMKSGRHFYLREGSVISVLHQSETTTKLPEKLNGPSCVEHWPDDGTLVIGDAKGRHLWAFRIEKDGALTNGDRYYALRMKPGETESHVSALTADDKSRMYACTPLGVQVFDPTGRLCGVIARPGDGDLTGIAFGGEKGDLLFVACGDKVYSRKLQGKSVLGTRVRFCRLPLCIERKAASGKLRYNEGANERPPQSARRVDMKIVKFPHPALRYKSVPLTAIDQKIHLAVGGMLDLMFEAKGLGLAANQVGLPYQILILNEDIFKGIESDKASRENAGVYLNPVIMDRTGSIEGEEGCLSFPDLYQKVRRAKAVKVVAYNLKGEAVEIAATDLAARAWQHEVDHLHGVLYIDKMGPIAKLSSRSDLRKFERDYKRAQEKAEIPPDDKIKEELDALAKLA